MQSSAGITPRKLRREFTYDNTAVLTLTIEYFEVSGNTAAENRINARIKQQTERYTRYASGNLYRQAVISYRDSKKNGFPFHAYEAFMKYEVTYNRGCHLSAYRDQYEFTGGAHGNTIRASDTWSLVTGRTLPLSHFFEQGANYRNLLLEQIIKQAEKNIKQNPGIYFDNYQSLIKKYFNEKSYYLTSRGLAVYYQQYEIAPYSTGIVVFTIPYDTLGWRPECPKA